MQEPKLIDAFPGFNEVDLARFRIEYLANLVDRVVIAESDLTHSGKPKPLYFMEWLESCENWIRDKVIVLNVPLSTESTSWEREIFTREYLANYLTINFSTDFFILSDLDEIPSSKQIKLLRTISGIYHFQTPTFYRKANWQLTDEHLRWKLGVMGEVKNLSQLTNGGRFEKLPLIEFSPGAHLSYFGAKSSDISRKYSALAHTELDKSFWGSDELLAFCDYFRIDHLGRSRNLGFGLFNVINLNENEVVEAISKTFPQNYDEGLKIPNRIFRIYASIYLTSYVRDSTLPRLKRSVIKPRFFFGKYILMFLLPPVIEIHLTLLSYLSSILKRKIKLLRGGVS